MTSLSIVTEAAHCDRWLRVVGELMPYGLSIAQLLSANEIVLLRIVHRSLAIISHEAAAYILSAVWRPLTRMEVVDAIHQCAVRDDSVKRKRISFPLLPRGGLTCLSSSYPSLLSSLRSLDLSSVVDLINEDLDDLMRRCSNLSFLDLSGSAANHLTDECELFQNPQSIACRSSLLTLRFCERVHIGYDAWDFHLPFDVSYFPNLTNLHCPNNVDNALEIFSQLPLLSIVTINEMYVDAVNISKFQALDFSSLTEVNILFAVYDQMDIIASTNMRLRKLSISMDPTVTTGDITIEALTTLLNHQSACHNTLEELQLWVETLPLDCLFNLCSSLPALRSLDLLCEQDRSESIISMRNALRNLLNKKRHQLLSLRFPKQVSVFDEGETRLSNFDEGQMMLPLFEEGSPVKLLMYCDSSSWNEWLFDLYERSNQTIDPSVNQSIDHSVNQLIDQSINRPIDQSINQSLFEFQDLALNCDQESKVPLSLQSFQLSCFKNLVRLELRGFPLILPSCHDPQFQLLNLRHLEIHTYVVMMNASMFVWWSRVAPHVIEFHCGTWYGQQLHVPACMDQTFSELRKLKLRGFQFERKWWDGISRLPHLRMLEIELMAQDVMQLEHFIDIFTTKSDSFPLLMEFRVIVPRSLFEGSSNARLILQSLRTRALQIRPYLKLSFQ